MTTEYIVSSLQDLDPIATSLLESGYTTFLLQGELGVGKTQFVKSLVAQLGGNQDEVQSPTYTYMNSYHTPHKSVIHMDLYRLETQEAAFSKGIFEEIDNHDIVCIEWPQREENYTDMKTVRLLFCFLPDNSRKIIVSPIS